MAKPYLNADWYEPPMDPRSDEFMAKYNPRAVKLNNIASGSSGFDEAPYKDLTTDLNKFMTDQAVLPYIMNLPNYQSMLGRATGNTGSLLRGEVPDDVLKQIQQSGAERGVATGGPGSPGANAAWLKALGLTSTQLQQQGQQNFSQLIQDTPVSPLFNPASLFVPERLAQQELNANIAGRRSVGGTGGGGGGGYGFDPLGLAKQFSAENEAKRAAASNRSGSYVSGFTPNNSSNAWSLPYGSSNPSQGWNSAEIPYNDLFAQPGGGGFGDWSDMNADNYVMAQDAGYQGVPQYDYGQMFADAGADFTDWSQSDFDWSQYE